MSSMLNKPIELLQSVLVLPNGSTTTEGAHRLIVSNTCGFDSFAQIMACIYVDNEIFKSQIDALKEKSGFCSIISQMSGSFARLQLQAHVKKVTKLRTTLLMPMSEVSDCKNNIRAITCTGNMNHIIERCCRDLFSYQRVKECLVCGHEMVSKRAFVDIDLNLLKKLTLKSVSQCILNELINETRQTRKAGTCEECGGLLDIAKTEFNNIIMLDTQTCIDLKTNKQIDIEPCKLDDIPTELQILDTDFDFVGCVAYVGSYSLTSTQHASSVGHYVAHVRRKNNQFETYDDLKPNKSRSPKTPVNVTILIYLKRN